MEDFKNLSYYDQLRQLVKLQDSYRRISSVPQSQPMDLISDLQANPPNFQSIESIKGVLESPHTESICDSMDVMHSPSETLYGDSGHSRFKVSGDVRRPKTMEDEEFEFSTQRVSAKKSHVANSPPYETHVARSFEVEEEPVHLKQVESSQRTLSPTLAPSSRDVLFNLEVDLGKEMNANLEANPANSGPRTSDSSANLIPGDQVTAQECLGNPSEEIRREPNDRSSSMGINFTRESRPQITLEDNLRKLEALAQQQTYMIQQWWPPTKQVTSELDQEFRDHQTDFLRKERSPTLSPLKKPIFSCQKEDSTIGADEDRQILYVSSVEESSPSKTGEDLNEISTTIDTSENSVCLNLESELGREDREVLSSSTEKTNSEFKEGNSKYSEFDLIDLDGNELSSWMRNCEEWESRALVGYLSFRNLHLHPLDADNNVDTRQIQSMMMKQHLGSAHEVFEKMSKKEIVHVDDSIGLLITLRGGFGLIGSTSSFVFDPGKGLELSSHLKESRRS